MRDETRRKSRWMAPRQSCRMWLATLAAVRGCAPASSAPRREARHRCQRAVRRRPHVRGRLPCRPGTLHAGVVLNFRAVPRVRLVTRGQSHGVCHGVSGFACASGTALIGVRSPGHRLRIWPCFASTSPAPLPWTLLHLARHSDYLQALCVRRFQPSLSLRLCSWLVCCLANFCIPCAVAVRFCLRTIALLCPRHSFFFFFFFFLQGRSCLTGDSTRPQRKACKTSVTAPPPKERARKGVPRTEQRARTQAETDGHSARNAEVCQQHTSQLHKAGNGMAGSNAHTMPADGPNVWRGAAKSLGEVVSSLTQQARQANARQGAAQALFKQAPTSSRQASLPGAQACSRKPNNLMPGKV